MIVACGIYYGFVMPRALSGLFSLLYWSCIFLAIIAICTGIGRVIGRGFATYLISWPAFLTQEQFEVETRISHGSQDSEPRLN